MIKEIEFRSHHKTGRKIVSFILCCTFSFLIFSPGQPALAENPNLLTGAGDSIQPVKTIPPAVKIRSIVASNITDNSVKIGADIIAAKGDIVQVLYWKKGAENDVIKAMQVTGAAKEGALHYKANLSGLQANTNYGYIVRIVSPAGQVKLRSGINNFVTLPPAGNHPPVAQDISATLKEDNILNGTLSGSDPDGGPLSPVLVTSPQNGILTITPNGSFTYTPNSNFNGTDSFTYRFIDNGKLQSNVATATLTVTAVNDAPVANAQSVSFNEDSSFTGSLAASDVDGDPLTYFLVQPPAHGTLNLSANGNFSFVPAADYNGTDSFTFKVSDNQLNSSPATMTFTINAVNDIPVVSAIQISASDVDPQKSGLQIYPGSVTYSASANDTDGDTLHWRWAYSVNGGAETNFLQGTGNIQNAVFDYSNLSVPATYQWTLYVGDNIAADIATSLSVEVISSPDTTAPVISNVATSGLTHSTVTMDWTTNENADTQIEYGTSINYGSSTTLNPSMVTSHSQSLSGLSASTLYHYRVLSRDAAGNLAMSQDFTFTTSAAPDTTAPVISQVASSNVTSGGATIKWTTDENSDTQIEYGKTTAYGNSTTLNTSMVTSHSQNLTGLTASTTYHYRVKSKDAAGNLAVSADFTFTTPAASGTKAPTIQDVNPTNTITIDYTKVFTQKITATGLGPIAFTVVNMPSFGTFKDNGNGSATLTFDKQSEMDNGTYQVTVTATNSAGSTSKTFTVVCDCMEMAMMPEIRNMNGVNYGYYVMNHGGGAVDFVPDFGSTDSNAIVVTGQVYLSSIIGSGASTIRVASGGHLIVDGDFSNKLVGVIRIEDQGKVSFKTDVNTGIKVGTLLVLEGGTLEVGTQSNPVLDTVTAKITIADQAIDYTYDVQGFGTGIIGFGNVEMYGAVKTAAVDATPATDLFAGATIIQMAQPVVGHKPGDILVLMDTRQMKQGSQTGGGFVPQWEEVTIASISADGKTITLASRLKFNHLAVRDYLGNVEYMPQVSNITRNIKIQSENAQGTRGHTVFMHRADVNIQNVEFKDLGRTSIAALDNTTFDSAGKVTKIGTNQQGRYTLHAHNLIGPKVPPANGHQYTFAGNSIVSPSKWGVTIHASHYGLIKENVVYDSEGGAFVTEDGSESYNVFERNMAVAGMGHGDRMSWDINAVAFNFRGQNNYMRDNVAANFYAYTSLVSNVGNVHGNVTSSNPGEIAYAFRIWAQYVGNRKIPKFPGANPAFIGQYQTVDINSLPILELSGFTGAFSGAGGTIWWVGWGVGVNPLTTQVSNIDDFHIFYPHDKAFYNYPSSNLHFNNFRAIMDRTGYNICCGVAFVGGDYNAPGLVFNNPYIEGFRTGIFFSVASDNGPQTINGGLFVNNGLAVSLPAPWHNSAFKDMAIKALLAEIHDSRFINNGKDISMTAGGEDAIERWQLFAFNVTSDKWSGARSFRIFDPKQLPTATLPQISIGQYNNVFSGSPVAGLTNQQNWDLYGLALGGELAVCADGSVAQPMAGITGVVCSFNPASPPAISYDLTPAKISNVVVTPSSAAGTAQIDFKTSENTKYVIYFGDAKNVFNLQPIADPLNFTTQHSATFTGLTAGATYYYGIVAIDVSGNTTALLRGSFTA